MSDSTETIRQSIERTRQKVREQRVATLRTRVSEALECAPALKATVYLFGSLASGRFDGLSDVDLLVLVPEETAVAEAERRLMGVADDVVACSDVQWSERLKGDNAFFQRVDADRVLLVDTRERAQ
jgi:predicted nucleotidyltransferase